MQHWKTLLGWGLLASLLLHWVALDLLRGAGFGPSGAASPVLLVRLDGSAANRDADGHKVDAADDAVAKEPPAVTASASRSAALAPSVRHSPLPETVMSQEGIAAVETSLATDHAKDMSVASGLRSGSLDEAMLALRLNVAEVLRGSPRLLDGLPAGSRTWVLEFDASGRLMAVQGEMPEALRAGLAAAISRVSVPEALRGRLLRLSLDLE
ncbi:MAG: hypothetical protein QM776_17985 [Rhodocyclaceae bacterium]